MVRSSGKTILILENEEIQIKLEPEDIDIDISFLFKFSGIILAFLGYIKNNVLIFQDCCFPENFEFIPFVPIEIKMEEIKNNITIFIQYENLEFSVLEEKMKKYKVSKNQNQFKNEAFFSCTFVIYMDILKYIKNYQKQTIFQRSNQNVFFTLNEMLKNIILILRNISKNYNLILLVKGNVECQDLSKFLEVDKNFINENTNININIKIGNIPAEIIISNRSFVVLDRSFYPKLSELNIEKSIITLSINSKFFHSNQGKLVFEKGHYQNTENNKKFYFAKKNPHAYIIFNTALDVNFFSKDPKIYVIGIKKSKNKCHILSVINNKEGTLYNIRID